MRRNRNELWFFILVLVGLAVTLISANAATPLSYESALEIAKKQNPQLMRSEEAHEGSSWRLTEALSSNLPRVQASGMHLFNVQYFSMPFGNMRVNSITPKSIYTLGAYWTVFDGFQGLNATRAASRAKEASAIDLERTRFQTTSELRTNFYRTLASQALVSVNQENVKALREHLDKTQDTLKRGSSTKFDVLKIQVQLEEAEAEEQQSLDQLAISYRQLANVMGDDSAAVSLAGQIPEPIGLSDAQAESLKNEQNLDAASALLRADAADLQSTSALGSYLPKLTFYGERQFYKTDNFSMQNPYLSAHAVGVTLAWSIFDLGLISRERQSSHAAAEAKANARFASLTSQSDKEVWLRRLRYSQYLFRAKKRAEEFAKEELRLAKLGYSAGTRTSTDVLDAQVDLFRAQAGILKAQIDNIEAQGKLETSFGRAL